MIAREKKTRGGKRDSSEETERKDGAWRRGGRGGNHLVQLDLGANGVPGSPLLP
jgi:hypothetical protein